MATGSFKFNTVAPLILGTDCPALKYELCRGFVSMYRRYPNITDIDDVANMFMLEPVMMSLSMLGGMGGLSYFLVEEMSDMWEQASLLYHHHESGGGGEKRLRSGGSKKQHSNQSNDRDSSNQVNKKQRTSAAQDVDLAVQGSPSQSDGILSTRSATKKRRRLDYNESESNLSEIGERRIALEVEMDMAGGNGAQKRRRSFQRRALTSSKDAEAVVSLTPLDPDIHIANFKTLNPKHDYN